MRLNKRVIESLVVVATASALSVTAFASPVVEMRTVNTAKVETSFDTNGIAGVASIINEAELTAYNELGNQVSFEKLNVEMVASSIEESPEQEVTVEEPQLSEEELAWQDKLMTTVDDSLNVRESADPEAAIVGKLRKGDLATIVEVGESWTQITSGNVNGYVANDYCVFGTDAMNYAKANCPTIATATVDCLRIRSEMSTESSIIKVIAAGNTITVDTAAEIQDGWVAVSYNGTTCYVASEFVTVALQTSTGVTLEEEAAARAAAEAAKRQKEAEAIVQYGASVAAETDDVTLLACLIQCECGGSSYEAQLAVGAVVVNRIKSGNYPNNLYDVIYQRGQFGPARNGSLARRLSSGPSSTAYAAAEAALAGQDNTGGLLHFNAASSGMAGDVIGSMVFY